MIRHRFIFILLVCLISSLYGQEMILKGKIIDSNTKKPLSGANILIKGTQSGTSTNPTGEFELLLIELPVDLQINYIGYEQVYKRVVSEEYVEIELKQIVLPGESVNVEGSKKPLNITESGETEIYSIRQLEYRGFRDAAEALSDVEGIYLEKSNEGAQKIRIRGSNVNEVSVFVDGVKLNNSFNREANISFIDLSMVENLIIKKGGITTLYGPGNYGGVVFVDTEDPENTYIKGKRSLGLSEDTDVDQIVSAGVKVPYLGGNYYRSVRKRKFDGINIYSSYFTSGGVSIIGPNQRLSFKHQDLINQIEVNEFGATGTGAILAGDSLQIDQINFSGDLFFLKNWYITAGKRNLVSRNSEFSNFEEFFNDSTNYAVVMKKWRFGFFDITTQIEQEKGDYNGLIRLKSASDTLEWDEKLSMSQVDKGWAGIIKHNFQGTTRFDSVWFEIAVRQSRITIEQDQQIYYQTGYAGLDSLNNQWKNSHKMSTLRFGIQGNDQNGPLQRVLYLNQGFNYNTPTLSQYLLLGNGKSKLEREEALIKEQLLGWVHEDSLVQLLGQLEQNQFNQSVYPDSLLREYVTSTEAGIRMVKNRGGSMILRWEFSAALFFNRLSNKLVWRNFGNDIIVPDNIPLGSIFGGEVSGAAFFPHFKISGSFGYVHPDKDILYQVLPKTSGKLTLEWYSKWLNIVMSNYYQGRVQSFRGYTGILNLPPVINSNLNLTAKYDLWKINLMLTYTVQNLFDRKSSAFNYGSWNRDFNYYDSHRKLLTLKAQVYL